MIKYVVHAVTKRMWFVMGYIVPTLLEQGVKKDEISIWNDKSGVGNLQSFLLSCDHYNGVGSHGGMWHLQDDVVLASDFAERTRKLSKDFRDSKTLICGYVGKTEWEKHIIGRGVKTNKLYPKLREKEQRLPCSFPCLYIPNSFLGGINKFAIEAAEAGKYARLFVRGTGDDYIFRKYVDEKLVGRTTVSLYICGPTLVEHIGHEIGGSCVYKAEFRRLRTLTSFRFGDRAALNRFYRFIGKGGQE